MQRSFTEEELWKMLPISNKIRKEMQLECVREFHEKQKAEEQQIEEPEEKKPDEKKPEEKEH